VCEDKWGLTSNGKGNAFDPREKVVKAACEWEMSGNLTF